MKDILLTPVLTVNFKAPQSSIFQSKSSVNKKAAPFFWLLQLVLQFISTVFGRRKTVGTFLKTRRLPEYKHTFSLGWNLPASVFQTSRWFETWNLAAIGENFPRKVFIYFLATVDSFVIKGKSEHGCTSGQQSQSSSTSGTVITNLKPRLCGCPSINCDKQYFCCSIVMSNAKMWR